MEVTAILQLKNLSLAFGKRGNMQEVLHKISFDLYENEIVGLVGESGSGKSVTSLAIMGLLPKQISKISSGSIVYGDTDLLKANSKSLEKLRGNKIAMIFQEPMSALNPALRCGHQVAEVLQIHKKHTRDSARKEVLALFERVKLPDPKKAFSSYPHQLSGGQLQRIVIAMAIACKPRILIADEPTTALDVTVQKEIIQLIKNLQAETQMSVLFISHDLTLVSEIANRVLVMYQGKLIEAGNTQALFKTPKQKYTKALLNARPALNVRQKKLPTVKDLQEPQEEIPLISAQERALKHKAMYTKAPLLQLIDLKKDYISKPGIFGKKQTIRAVAGVSFSVFEGETLGLVGESGCGKSTLGKTIMHIEQANAGTILYRGKDITSLTKKELISMRKEIQIVFQDPFASLHPRLTIGQAIAEPISVHFPQISKTARKREVLDLLERVGLDTDYYNRYPHELSGGQRQRIGIARAIALKPKLLICDESVSALDISVQAQVLNLLNELKEQFNFTYIFISHDLAVVKYMADQLVVMNKGKIEEIGDADEVYANPRKSYTKKLIDAIPKGLN